MSGLVVRRSHLPVVLVLASQIGCASGSMESMDGGGAVDAPFVRPDIGVDTGAPPLVDAAADPDARVPADAAPVDAGDDAGAPGADGGGSGTADAGDSPPDGSVIACAGIASGDTPLLDGSDDLAAYETSQVIMPGAFFDPSSRFGITWDATHLYLSLRSGVFADPFRPLHVYVESAPAALSDPVSASGKEYGGQIPVMSFSPTHLIALRRTSVSEGSSYNGIFIPSEAGDWVDQPVAFIEGSDYFSSEAEASVRVRWSDLGCPTRIRLHAHVVNAVIANEWKDVLPSGATPWGDPDGGAFYEIDLSDDPAVASWIVR